MLQLLLGDPSALADGAQLLRGWRTDVTLIMAAMLPRSLGLLLAHTGIVPPAMLTRKDVQGSSGDNGKLLGPRTAHGSRNRYQDGGQDCGACDVQGRQRSQRQAMDFPLLTAPTQHCQALGAINGVNNPSVLPGAKGLLATPVA